PVAAVVPAAGPDLGAVDDVAVAVAHGPRAQRGEVGAGVGFAEQLAPLVLPAEDGRQVALLLLLGAGEEDGGRRPADAYPRGPADPGPVQLLVDDELVHRIGVEAPRLGPVGHHVAGFGH